MAHSEDKALRLVVERLHRRFPEASEESVRAVFTEVLATYDGSRIRDFVPVLVERDAAARLRRPAGVPLSV